MLNTLKKFAPLVLIPLVLAGLAYGAQKLTLYSWNQVVEYDSPYTAPLPSGSRGDPLVGQVVLVVVDGLRLDTSQKMPNLNRLRAQGADLVVRTGEPSLSYPTWTTISSGAFQEISGVTTNWYEGEVKADSIFKEAQAAGLRTAIVGVPSWEELFGSWVEVGMYVEYPPDASDKEAVYKADSQVLSQALQVLRKEKPDLLLVYFDGSDLFGHDYGGASPEYREEALRVDKHLAKLAEAIDLESTTLIITADHGQIDRGGHGGWEEVVKRVPLVLVGKGIRAGAYPEARQANIAPTVAALLGTSIPTHSQGEALLSLINAPADFKGRRGLDVALQLVGFYDAYAKALEVKPFAGQLLSVHREVIARGEEGALTNFAQEVTSKAQQARQAQLRWERLKRTPLALAILVLPALYILFSRPRKAWLIPLLGAVLYLAIYNGLFFGRGLAWSISVFNKEEQIEPFFAIRLLDAALAIIVAGLVAGAVNRGRTKYEAARGAIGTSFLVGYLLLLQIVPFYWLYDVRFPWYIPDLRLGFKYYLDLLQMVSTGFLALVLPLLALGAQWVAGRLPRRRGEQEPVRTEAGDLE